MANDIGSTMATSQFIRIGNVLSEWIDVKFKLFSVEMLMNKKVAAPFEEKGKK